MSGDVTIIIQDGGALGEGGTVVPPPPPHGDVYWYGDIPSSIDSTGGVVSAWGLATSVSGVPLVETDSVTDKTLIRTSASSKLIAPDGTAGFMSEDEWTFEAVWRQRKASVNGHYTLLDTTEGGTKRGVQVLAFDESSYWLMIAVKIHDGSSFVLDTSNTVFDYGSYIPLKWHVISVRVSATAVNVRVDGRETLYENAVLSVPFPGPSTGQLWIGPGLQDFMAIELYASLLSTSDVIANEVRLAARFAVETVVELAGPIQTTPPYSSFPSLSTLASGRLLATIYEGINETPNTVNRTYGRISTDTAGYLWGPRFEILVSDAGVRYTNVNTSKVLSNGDILGAYFTYDPEDFDTVGIVRSTDDGATWGAPTPISKGGLFWAANSGSIVEYPTGVLHLPAYVQDNALDTVWSIDDFQSTDFGATWPTRVRVADGIADSKKYAEAQFQVRHDGLYCLIRNVTDGIMFQTRSTDSGATWVQPPVTTAMLADSAAQGLATVGGLDLWPGRPFGFNESAIYSRVASTAWDTVWNNSPYSGGTAPWVDVAFDRSHGYGGIVETSPGIITVLAGSIHSPTHSDVFVRPNLPTWLFSRAMPGSAAPTTATVVSLATQLISMRGAGGYIVSYTTNASGGSVVAQGPNLLYTAGASNGVDTFTISDLNAKLLASCSFTVTGGSGAWDPVTDLPNVVVVYEAADSTNTGDGTKITAWDDELGAHDMAQTTDAVRLTYVASGINSKPQATGAGGGTGMYTDSTPWGTTAITLGVAVAWTSSTANRIVFGSQYNGYHYSIGTDATNPGQVDFRLGTDGQNLTTIKSDSTSLNDGVLHDVICTWDGSTMRMYVDGVLQAETASVSGTIDTPASLSDLNSIGGGVSTSNQNAPFGGFIGIIKGAVACSAATSAPNVALLHTWLQAL